MSGQPELFPLTLTAILPDCPRGGDLAFIADVNGQRYFCKRDIGRRRIRLTEWFAYSIALHVGIAVPDFAPIFHPGDGDVYFGSKGIWGTAEDFEVRAFLTTPPIRDRAIGAWSDWKGRYLSRLYILDLFLANPDRQICNFLMAREGGADKLFAFDFAASDLSQLGSTMFPIAESQTLFIGRLLRGLQGFHPGSAGEMIDRLGAIPANDIDAMIASMPEDWLSGLEKETIGDLWRNGSVGHRLDALRRGIADESLL